MRLVLLIFKNLLRNKLRTALTGLAIFFLVAVFTMIATVLRFLESAMADKEKDVKSIATERYRIPSRFDRRYVDDIVKPGSVLNDQLQEVDGFQEEMYTVWHFVGFTLDPELKDKDQIFFCIATIPEKIGTMTDGLEGFDPDQALAAKMKQPPVSGIDNIGLLVGPDRLKKIKKKVGDVFKAYSISHRDGRGLPIQMEMEIVGELPGESRWAQGAFMDLEYLDRVLRDVKSDLDGKVNLGWFQTKTPQAAADMAGIVEKYISDLKCETASSAVSRFLEPFKDLLFGVKFLLVPAIFVVMTVIVANAIGITVRERRQEIAVLKVLGFSSRQVLTLVLGEGLLIGILAGTLGSALTFVLVNSAGIKIPIGFFPVFYVPEEALTWGPIAGGFTALVGSLLPAWSARRVKVVDVFSKVA
ncbi:MAG TPA: ABC transporter permease [Gemmatales bacterium]|nr:ABC transporter permease [Gemmatales bacterium]HMP60984.1 ABC transporter permease [Gemmatales bacterium]